MTEQEKELVDIMGEITLHKTKYTSNLDLAKAIIQRYPQITKKPVKIELYKGIIDHSIFMPCVAIAHHDDAPQFNSTGENGRQKWLDEHYVEVVE